MMTLMDKVLKSDTVHIIQIHLGFTHNQIRHVAS